MKEMHFNTEVVRSLRYWGGWAFKIPDSPITKELVKLTRFTIAKPCDIMACFDGRMVAVEGKQLKQWRAFGIREMRPEQIIALTDIVAHGGRAFIFLNIRIKKPYENRLIILDWKIWGPRLRVASIKAKELRVHPHYGSFVVKNDHGNEKRIFDLDEWRFYL